MPGFQHVCGSGSGWVPGLRTSRRGLARLFGLTGVGLGLGINLLVLSPAAGAQQQPPKPAPSQDRVGFPAGYQASFHVLYDFDRPDAGQVLVAYGNDQAAAANPHAGPNDVFPYGSVIAMEIHPAVLDDDGNPVLDENGRFVPGPVAAIPTMRKESGFGEAYQIQRSGEWEFAVYRPDGTPQVKPQDSNFCAECHQDAGSTKDWVFRGELFFNHASGALPQSVPSLAEAGRVMLRSYLFVPDTLTVKTGTTVTWANDDDGLGHTITADDGSFDSGRMGSGATFSHTFDSAGAYAYQCAIHPKSMQGTVVVQD
jgi:plastocyanin